MILAIENFVNAGFKTVRIINKNYFWVKMKDVEKGLGLKCIRNLVRIEIIGILGINKRCD